MNSVIKTGAYLLTGFLGSTSVFLSVPTAVHAQQASLLRPSLYSGQTNNASSNDNQPVSILAPLQKTNGQQTNAPQVIRLQSNQPQTPPLPPPPPRRQPQTDPFAPTGVPFGGFRLFPVLEVTSVFSDNVRTNTAGKIRDVGLRLAPSLRLQSDWVRHSLALDVNGESIFYAKANDVNTNTLSATSAFRFDIRRDVNLLNTTTYQLSQTSSASSEVPGTAIGNRRDHQLTYTAALTGRFNRMVATVTGGIDWLFYDDLKLSGGGKENNKDREYIEPSLRLRLGYEVSPTFTPFVEAGYTPRIHKKTRDRNGIRRDSNGLTGSAGFGFNLSPIWDGEVALVYDYRNFDDTTLASVNSLGLNATVNWRPTQLTTVTFTSATGIDESAAIGVSGTRNFDLALAVAHRFRENITGNLGFNFNYDDFVGNSNDDMTFTMNAGFAYAFRREMEWVGNYQFTHFKSGTAGSNYIENQITTGIRFRL